MVEEPSSTVMATLNGSDNKASLVLCNGAEADISNEERPRDRSLVVGFSKPDPLGVGPELMRLANVRCPEEHDSRSRCCFHATSFLCEV
jgi:hypothetical protein